MRSEGEGAGNRLAIKRKLLVSLPADRRTTGRERGEILGLRNGTLSDSLKSLAVAITGLVRIWPLVELAHVVGEGLAVYLPQPDCDVMVS